MWIVRLALRRPYTFVVAALLLLLMTPFVLLQTPTDIFPSINIPVVSVIWQYTGLSAKEIEQGMVYTDERALSTTVNNIEHIEPPGDCHSSRRRTGDIFFEAGMARTLEAALP